MKKFALAFLGVVLSFNLRAAELPSTVTIPVTEFLELRKAGELAKVTTVEEARLRGAFGKSLTLTFTGRCAGGLEPRDVLKVSDSYNLSGCKGDAMLDAGSENVRLVPLAHKFTLTCDVRPKNWNELEMEVLNSFSFSGEVGGAEVIAEPRGANHRHIAVTAAKAAVASAKSDGAVTGTAKYRVTVEPEESKFQYVFHLNNPSRGTRQFAIKWVNGEIVAKSRGLASYTETDDGTSFSLSPGDNEISVSGRFSGTAFKGLLPSEQQYLLIESHPTLQLNMQSKARRISNTDPELSAKYNNARLYFFGKGGEFSWTTRKLEVMEAMGYSITSADYRYYVPEFGRPVVEAHFALENQGTPEVAFEIPGAATYLEVNRQPQVLYRSPEGKLLVQLPTGKSSVYLQYRPERETGLLLTGQRADLVKPSTVLSNVSVSLLTPSKWKLLFGSSLVGARSDYNEEAIVFALLLGALFFAFGKIWDFPRRARRGLAVIGGALGFLSGQCFFLFAAAAVLLTLARYRMEIWRYFRAKPIRTAAVVGTLAIICFVSVVTLLNSFIGTSSRYVASKGISQYNNFRNSAPSQSLDEGEAPSADAAPPAGALGKGGPVAGGGPGRSGGGEPRLADEDGGGGGGGFQGLPAKIEIPWNVATTSFSQSLVDSRGRIVLRALLISQSVLNALALVLFAAAVGVFLMRRRTIMNWTLARAL